MYGFVNCPELLTNVSKRRAHNDLMRHFNPTSTSCASRIPPSCSNSLEAEFGVLFTMFTMFVGGVVRHGPQLMKNWNLPGVF